MVCCFSAGAKWGCHEWQPAPFTQASTVCVLFGESDHTGVQGRDSIKVFPDTKQVTWAKMSHARLLHQEAVFYRRNCVRAIILQPGPDTNRRKTGGRWDSVENRGHYGWREPLLHPCRLAKRQRWSQQETEEEAHAATPLWSITWARVCTLQAAAKPVTHTCFIRH